MEILAFVKDKVAFEGTIASLALLANPCITLEFKVVVVVIIS